MAIPVAADPIPPVSAQPLAILMLGDPRLETPCAPVTAWTAALVAQVAAMHATLNDFRARCGYGRALAAPQIGLLERIVVMNLGSRPFTLLNPEITFRSEEQCELWDDCLSIPDRIVRVRRHASISVVFRDPAWREHTWAHLPSHLAELLQHEIDHLDGILMLQRATGPDPVRPIAERVALIDAARRQFPPDDPSAFDRAQ